MSKAMLQLRTLDVICHQDASQLEHCLSDGIMEIEHGRHRDGA